MKKTEDCECKGAFFRCRVNQYIQGGKIRSDVSYTLLKRRSCTGIPNDDVSIACCHRALKHGYDNAGADIFDGDLELPMNPTNGAVYELKCHPPRLNYNSDGYVPYEDEPQWYLEKVEVE